MPILVRRGLKTAPRTPRPPRASGPHRHRRHGRPLRRRRLGPRRSGTALRRGAGPRPHLQRRRADRRRHGSPAAWRTPATSAGAERSRRSRTTSTPTSSGTRPGRRRSSILSSASSSRPRGKRWKTPATEIPRAGGDRSGSSPASRQHRLQRASLLSDPGGNGQGRRLPDPDLQRPRLPDHPGVLQARTSPGPASTSRPPAPPPWWRCTWPPRPSGTVTATWPWPAASAPCLRKMKGYLFEPGGIASPDGRTRAFDAAGGGNRRWQRRGSGGAQAPGGRGGGRRLRSAPWSWDPPSTTTAPSRSASQRPASRARRRPSAGPTGGPAWLPESLGYVEAHGTGTAMGDPIEVAALAEAFGAVPDDYRCAIGSAKTNVGHLDAAAGVTGLIKAVLALEHGEIPPSLHYERAQPRDPLRRRALPRAGPPGSRGRGGTATVDPRALATGRRQLLRHRRHQRPPGPGGSPRRQPASSPGSAGPGAPSPLRQDSRTALDPPGGAAGGVPGAANPPASPEELADAAFTLQVGRRAFAAPPCRGVPQRRRSRGESAGSLPSAGPPRRVER